MVAEHAARGEVVHEVGRVVLDHRDLLEHDLALGLERVGLEARARGHVAHHVERERQVLVEHAHVHDGRLAGREGVQLGAEAIGDARDLDLVVALAALEQQVLDEVRDAGLPGRSSRAPTPTNTPTATERTAGIVSEMTRRPSGSVVCSCTGLSLRQQGARRVTSGGARNDEPIRHRDRESLDDRRVELRSRAA